MSRSSAEHLPAWPALLTTPLACDYTSLSEVSFRFLMAQHGVEPRECGGLAVTRWRRADLDRVIDSLPARGRQMRAEGESETMPPEDPAEAALRRAERRAGA
jgi:hypothetical protein